MKKYSRLRAVIDLDAVMYNMEMMHANIEKGTKMVVVIKTDGYGRSGADFKNAGRCGLCLGLCGRNSG